VVSANPDKVEAYRGGRTALLGFFMGQVMRSSGGKADPEIAKALLEEMLEGG
jgi:glutaminyl-tRNA synthetase